MKGKHSQSGGSHNRSAAASGKKIAVIVIIIAIAAAAVIAGVFLLSGLFGGENKASDSQGTTSAVQTSAVQTSEDESSAAGQEEEVTAAQSSAEEQSDTQAEEQSETSEDSSSGDAEIVVPTISGEEQGEMFSATLTPYLAQDTGSGQELTIREVFGSSYSGGGLTFNEDGTFVDGFTASSSNSGAYIVEGDTIVATYSNDKNMIASVLEWNGTTPAEIKITFGEIDVYFK